MRIPVLLIAGLIALGPVAHAAEAPSDNVAPTAATAAEPSASATPAAATAAEPSASATPAAAPAPAAFTPPVYLSMDFTDVELPVLIKFMSEQTKKNFIFDERVQGKITIISPRRVTLDEAYDVFLYVLQAKGFTTVSQGNTIKIVAAREARQDTIHTGVSKDTASAEFITRLVPLQYLESSEVVPLVTQPMIDYLQGK